MAGQGAYAFNSRSAGYGAGAAGGAGAGVPERPAYVYGQSYEAMDEANGPYSVQPQMQTAYNPEAYGGYAYTTEGNQAAYAGGYGGHPYQAQQFEAHYQDNATTAPIGGAAQPRIPPALVAGAGSVPAGRSSQSTRSVYSEEDAYGGI